MRKLRLYKYPFAPGHVHDTIPEYRDTVPFSEDGIAKWCDLVPPQDAELFYCGQYDHSGTYWQLHPNRFAYFTPDYMADSTASKHVFDLEGDHSEQCFHPWLQSSIITAMNAEPNHRNWHCFVRPGCSMLLLDMVRNPRLVSDPIKHGFYFRGQRDPYGIREKLRLALELADVPHLFEFMPNWNAPTPVGHPDVQRYEAEMREWSISLCPSGTGQMSVRFFEACAMTRCPIIVANNLLFEEGRVPILKILPTTTLKQMALRLERLYEVSQGVWGEMAAGAGALFELGIRPYFQDPTAYLLARLQAEGLLDGHEWMDYLQKGRVEALAEIEKRNRVQGNA